MFHTLILYILWFAYINKHLCNFVNFSRNETSCNNFEPRRNTFIDVTTPLFAITIEFLTLTTSKNRLLYVCVYQLPEAFMKDYLILLPPSHQTSSRSICHEQSRTLTL